MLTKLWCWLFGHKFWIKAFIPDTEYATVNRLTGLPDIGKYYRWEKQKFCLRCETDAPPEEEHKEVPK